MKNNISNYKCKNINLKTTIYMLFLIMVISGFFGFIYETIFYRIDLGYFVKRGSTFGPWIPIYAFGGLIITLISYKFRKNIILEFIINTVVTGTLEYITGYVLYEYKSIRFWDYNNEIWNFGNINGYICLRSVLFFGFSSLFLIYVIIPYIKKIVLKISRKKLAIISITLITIFFIDIIAYAIIK